MRFTFLVLSAAFLLLSNQSMGQAEDSNRLGVGIIASVGMHAPVFRSEDYIRSMALKSHPSVLNTSLGLSPILYTSINKSNFRIYFSSPPPIISLGVALRSNKTKRINHIIETAYMQVSGEYSYSIAYQQTGIGGSFVSSTDVTENLKTQFHHQTIALSYKLQPSFRYFFLSFGASVAYNEVKCSVTNRQTLSKSPGVPGWSNTTDNTLKTEKNLVYINMPFQLGAGGCIHLKQLVLKPSFYFTPGLGRQYNFFNLLLGLQYNLYKS